MLWQVRCVGDRSCRDLLTSKAISKWEYCRSGSSCGCVCMVREWCQMMWCCCLDSCWAYSRLYVILIRRHCHTGRHCRRLSLRTHTLMSLMWTQPRQSQQWQWVKLSKWQPTLTRLTGDSFLSHWCCLSTDGSVFSVLYALCRVLSELHLVYATLRVFPYIFKSICLNSNILFSFLNLGKICFYVWYLFCMCLCMCKYWTYGWCQT